MNLPFPIDPSLVVNDLGITNSNVVYRDWSQGRPSVRGEAAMQQMLTANFSTSRQELFRKLGLLDRRRNLDDECGYPKGAVQPWTYWDLYDSDPIAARTVELYPRECLQVVPEIIEVTDSETDTPFEEAVDAFMAGLQGEASWFKDQQGSSFWEYVLRADIQSGIGQYGVILLGLDDVGRPDGGADGSGNATSYDLSKPVKGIKEVGSSALTVKVDPKNPMQPAKNEKGEIEFLPIEPLTEPYGMTVNADEVKGRKLNFIRVFPEAQAMIGAWENNPSSHRFGAPLYYNITLNNPRESQPGAGYNIATYNVHWTRVIHIADNLGSSEVLGMQRCRQVLRRILDAQKLYGGSAEMFWKNAAAVWAVESLPQVAGMLDVTKKEIQDTFESMFNGLQRFGYFDGMTLKSLSPTVADPTPQIKAQLEAICIKLGCPMRVFLGSERGELASSQDDQAWNDRIKARQQNYLSPRVIAPLIDRLIMIGVLPVPPQGYSIKWPDLTSRSDSEKAQTSLVRTQAITTYASQGGEDVMDPLDYYTEIMGYDDDKAQQIVDKAVKHQEDALKQEQDLVGKGLLPDPNQPSPDTIAKIGAMGGKPGAIPGGTGGGSGQPFPPKGPTGNEELDLAWNAFEAALVVNADLSGGRWVTTDEGNHVYIKDGEPVAGNPHVIKEFGKADQPHGQQDQPHGGQQEATKPKIDPGEAFIDEKKFFAGPSENQPKVSGAQKKQLESGSGLAQVEFHPKDLTPTQDYTGADKVKQLASTWQQDKARVTVVQKDGKNYIYDGHHTAAAAALVGKTVKARVLALNRIKDGTATVLEGGA